MATIKVPPVLRPSVGGEKEVSASGETVGAVLHDLAEQHPATQDAAVRRRRVAQPLRQRVPQRRGRAGARRARHRRRRVRHAGDPAGHGRRVIRPARADEAPALVVGLRVAVRPARARSRRSGTPSAPPRGSRAAIASDDAEVLVADVDGAVVGICTVYLDIESVRFGRRAWVEDLAVRPRPPLGGPRQGAARRRQGLGPRARRDAPGARLRPRRAPTRTASTSASSRAGARSASAGRSRLPPRRVRPRRAWPAAAAAAGTRRRRPPRRRRTPRRSGTPGGSR